MEEKSKSWTLGLLDNKNIVKKWNYLIVLFCFVDYITNKYIMKNRIVYFFLDSCEKLYLYFNF